jgi:hypothetical protein
VSTDGSWAATPVPPFRFLCPQARLRSLGQVRRRMRRRCAGAEKRGRTPRWTPGARDCRDKRPPGTPAESPSEQDKRETKRRRRGTERQRVPISRRLSKRESHRLRARSRPRSSVGWLAS